MTSEYKVTYPKVLGGFMPKSKLPDRFNVSFGKITLKKGLIDKGRHLVAWDSVPQCRKDECAAFDLCDFNKDNDCKVMAQYLKIIETTILGELDLSEGELMRVGLHLIPLYRNLCKLKITELGVLDPLSKNRYGNVSINPLYEQIKSHIVTIDGLWRAMGLDRKFKAASKKGEPGPIPSVEGIMETGDEPEGDNLTGDPNYYEKLDS